MTDTQDWRDQALCRNRNPEWWFPTGDAHTYQYAAQAERALAICRTCPVRQPCLEYALARLPHGVAGGMTEAQRSRLRLKNPGLVPDSAKQPDPDPVRPECGSEAGYQRHHRRNEPKCRPCLEAMNDRRNARERARRQEAMS
jgi:hypothetical protein